MIAAVGLYRAVNRGHRSPKMHRIKILLIACGCADENIPIYR